MPVSGFPDRSIHRICFRCHKWFEPGEGSLLRPEASGPLTAMHQLGESIAKGEPLLRFMCFRCQRIRRLTKWTIFLLFLVTFGAVLLLSFLRGEF